LRSTGEECSTQNQSERER
jgi:zinc finger CCCH domain-containing protein 13